MRNTTSTSETTEQNARQKAIPPMAELDMRDYFAAKAMQGFMAREGAPDLSYESELAYRMADSMLAAREDKQEGGAA